MADGKILWALFLPTVCVGVAGCNRPVIVREVAKSRANLSRISKAYYAATMNLERPPKSLEELMPHLGDFSAVILRSPDDGEEYVFRWGQDMRKRVGKGYPIIAHEKTGKDGKRYVLQGREVFHLDDEEFNAALKLSNLP